MLTEIIFRTYHTNGCADMFRALNHFLGFDNLGIESKVRILEIEILLPIQEPFETLADSYSRFTKRLHHKPKMQLIASTGKLKISYLSEVEGLNYDIFTQKNPPRGYGYDDVETQSALDRYRLKIAEKGFPDQLWEFVTFFQEIRLLFLELSSTIRKRYDLDCAPILERLEQLQSKLPKNAIALEHIIESAKAAWSSQMLQLPPPRVLYHSKPLPLVFPISHVEGKTTYIGVTKTGAQFWAQIITFWEFYLEKPEVRNEHVYVVLHKFDPDGFHQGTTVEKIGIAGRENDQTIARAKEVRQALIDTLGEVRYKSITIRLFQIQIEPNWRCGLIDTSTEEWGDKVTMEPLGLMFGPPWDGRFDT